MEVCYKDGYHKLETRVELLDGGIQYTTRIATCLFTLEDTLETREGLLDGAALQGSGLKI